ncbi:hypothetical protein HJG60_008596 [Phyllostomus discolor]|uniref:Uncharacterized protein n=1 Tax=Phyllostomus discolor TaxID=89673 RepID=A0A833Z3Q9_9CHIR|nr:hypothetical protein HJG60_008596 [Phyllostomus discolor]
MYCRIIHYLFFCDWLILLRIIPSTFIHVVVHYKISCLIKAEYMSVCVCICVYIYIYIYIYICILLIHSLFFNYIDYAITVVPIFLPVPPCTWHPYSLRQSPHLCSCPWVMHISSLATPFAILYFTFTWLFCNYPYVLLNSLTSLPIPLHPTSHMATIKMLSVFMILSLLFLFA